jgi:hypothetical protein
MYLQFPYCWNIALIIQRGARPGGVQQWRGAPTSGSSHGAGEGGCWAAVALVENVAFVHREKTC